MTLRKTIADLITDLSNPAPIIDPEDDFYEETGAKVVGGSFDEEGEDEDIHPSLESGRLRRRAALPLEERDVRYEGKKTSRKNLVEDESDEETYEEEDTSEEGELTSFKEMMKKKQQQRLLPTTTQRKPKKFHPGIKEDGDDLDDSGDEEEEEDEEVSGEEQLDDEDGGLQSDVDDEDDVLEESRDVYRGAIWERLKKMKESEEEGDDLNEEEEDEEDASCVEDEDDDESNEAEEEARDKSDDDETDIDVVSKVNLNEEIEKGVAAKNQQGLWDNFLESRIKLQKALQLSNQLPQYTTHHSYLEMEDDNEEEHIECVLEGQQKLKRLLKGLCKLQDELLIQNPETRHVVTGEKQKTSDSDEEIPSDEDEQPDTADEKREAELSTKRKIDLTNPGEELAKRHKRFVQYRDTVIHSWYDKTKLASGKLSSKSFSAFEKSPVEQVQQILMDKNRLIHRTQLKRSSYKVIGQSEKSVEVPPEDGDDEQIQTVRSSQLNETDPEIFDDDDFYHQLLKELIERKTADTTDPAQLTRQWLAVQKLRHKVKRVVDTKASKGRKLRYNIHPKMVSFTAPKDDSTMTDEARDELFSSLFGQARILTDGVR